MAGVDLMPPGWILRMGPQDGFWHLVSGLGVQRHVQSIHRIAHAILM